MEVVALGRRRAMALAIAAIVVGCTQLDTPVDPVWGKEPCAHCRMLVGDRRVAGQAVHGAERFFFDDPGCLVLWMEERRASTDGRAWVRDAEVPGRWIDARSARYVGGKTTPMDFGFEARSTGDGIPFAEMRERVMTRKEAAR